MTDEHDADKFWAYIAAHQPQPTPPPQPTGAGHGPVTTGDVDRYVAAVCHNVATAANGTRNAKLNGAAYTLGRVIAAGQLYEPDVVHALTQAGHAAGLDDDEIPATIASGLTAGRQHPRALAPGWTVPDLTVLDQPPAPAGPLEGPEIPKRMRDGAAFILDAPTQVPTLWGDNNDVIWARGEALMIVGPPGVGKTTLTGQILRARIGLGDNHVLGYPIERTVGRILYLAMDRPAQIARALRRTFTEAERDHLSQHLAVWEGPPPADIAKRPEILAGLASLANADTLIIDSLKDAAIGLGEDEVAAGYNRARQMALVDGVQILELHHLVKRGPNGAKPTTLADVYGSAWLTAGAGSVVLLWGAGGDPVVSLAHLKQPAGEVGPFRVIHDHTRGTSDIFHGTDLLTLIASTGAVGITPRAAAGVLYDKDKPTASEIEKARRRLDQLVTKGLVTRHQGIRGGADGGTSTTYKSDHAPITVLSENPPITAPKSDHDSEETRRSGDHATDHGDHAPGAITIGPPFIRGPRVAPTENQDQDDLWNWPEKP